MAAQLQAHLKKYIVLDEHQSAYRAGHSTETAMLKIKSDINTIVDRGDSALLILLDLRAAFDTVDHTILLKRLKQSVGIQGTVLKWMASYLKDRTQFVCVCVRCLFP